MPVGMKAKPSETKIEVFVLLWGGLLLRGRSVGVINRLSQIDTEKGRTKREKKIGRLLYLAGSFGFSSADPLEMKYRALRSVVVAVFLFKNTRPAKREPVGGPDSLSWESFSLYLWFFSHFLFHFFMIWGENNNIHMRCIGYYYTRTASMFNTTGEWMNRIDPCYSCDAIIVAAYYHFNYYYYYYY